MTISYFKISKTVNTERKSPVACHTDERHIRICQKTIFKLRRSGEVNSEFIVGRPVNSVSDASARGIFNYGSSA